MLRQVLETRGRARRRRTGAIALAVSLATVGLVADASAQCGTYGCQPTTLLLSKTPGGHIPDGPSRNAAISQDERLGRVAAFESDATNLVSSDRNGRLTDIFIVNRKSPFGTNGTRWVPGATKLITKTPRGFPANGRSSKPVVSGNVEVGPACVAFISNATNLVYNDTNGKADAFVYYLGSGKIERVSVNSSGQQSNGTTYDVAVDGRCERVAFTSDASNLALTKTSKSQWKSAVTTNGPRGMRQVYSRFVREPKYSSSGLKGLTFLASATNGRAGNGHSSEPTLPSRKGDAIGFTSRARNLSSIDRNAFSDIYWRQAPLQRISSGLTQSFRLYLLSKSRTGGDSNGNSSAPVASGNHVESGSGTFVAYQTDSTNVGGPFQDRNRATDIVRSHLNDGRVSSRYLSNGQAEQCTTGLGNGPSQRPTISEAGSTVMYDTDASNFTCHGGSGDDRNGKIADVFVWTEKRQGSILFSLNSNGDALRMDSRNPFTSARINYYMWETREPYTDLALAGRDNFPTDPQGKAALRARAAREARYHQVYMRYAGPE